MIGGCLDLILSQSSSVVGHSELNWLSSGNCSFVGYQVEIKVLVTLIFYKTNIQSSSWARINIATIVFIEKSMRDVSINKNVKDPWPVVLCEGVNRIFNLFHFNFQAFFSEGWTTNTVSINNDLLWQSSFVFLLMLLKSFLNIINHYFSSSGSYQLLFIILR